MFHQGQFWNRRLHTLYCEHILLVIELLYQLVHGSSYLLIPELNILCKVLRAEFILRFDELSYETLQSQTHAVYWFCDVTLRTHAHNLIKEELMWPLVDLAFKLLRHADCTRIELIFFPKGQTAFKGVFHIYNLIRWELEFYYKPLQRENPI